jgi:hypothetical protein
MDADMIAGGAIGSLKVRTTQQSVPVGSVDRDLLPYDRYERQERTRTENCRLATGATVFLAAVSSIRPA